MSKHTPEPWEVCYVAGVAVGVGPAEDMGDGAKVFTIIGNTVGDGHTDKDVAEINANAELVAASPKLLNIVQRLVAYNGHYSVATHAEWDDMIHDARAAIAKAEGKS